MEKEKKDNPGHVTPDLCEAYRGLLNERINGLRNQIIGAITLSTAILALITLIANGS